MSQVGSESSGWQLVGDADFHPGQGCLGDDLDLRGAEERVIGLIREPGDYAFCPPGDDIEGGIFVAVQLAAFHGSSSSDRVELCSGIGCSQQICEPCQ